MAELNSSILIIGAGPAGEAAATTLRRLNKDIGITVVEKDHVGGLCLNKGCIPSKTLLEFVHRRINLGQPIDWKLAQAEKASVVTNIRSNLETRFKRERINLIYGSAQFISPNAVEVIQKDERQEIKFDKAIIAIGTEIYFPEAIKPFASQVLTSDTMLLIDNTPASIVVVGGGAIGCEFACLLNAAGAKVTIIEMKDQLIPGEDKAVTSALQTSFENRGIELKLGTVVSRCEKTPHGWTLTLSNNEQIHTEQLLNSVGRVPVLGPLQLSKAGIEFSKTGITVDAHRKTSNPHVYAVGDVAGSRLAHHAASLGETAAINILGGSSRCDDRFVPRCLYSWPEVASIGEWKHEREDKNLPVKTSRAFFKGSAKAMASGETEGFVQIVFDPETRKLLGAQIIGPHATELIHIFSVALKADMTLNALSEIMFAHPTLSEVIKEAVKK